eukprot:2597569-Pyramimonas_sp.AAC.1
MPPRPPRRAHGHAILLERRGRIRYSQGRASLFKVSRVLTKASCFGQGMVGARSGTAAQKDRLNTGSIQK